MTVGGWIFMSVSVVFVVSLAAWCYRRMLAAPSDSPEGPRDRAE